MFVNKHFTNSMGWEMLRKLYVKKCWEMLRKLYGLRNIKIKNAKFSGYYIFINTNISRDFQICISVPLRKLCWKDLISFSTWMIIKEKIKFLSEYSTDPARQRRCQTWYKSAATICNEEDISLSRYFMLWFLMLSVSAINHPLVYILISF